MCGIVGFINLSGVGNVNAERAFEDMLIANQVRGSDATGVMMMNTDGETDWVKNTGLPSDLLSSKAGRDFGRHLSNFVWAGHNRAKTVGANTNDNAHPFQHDHIIGMHNGSLRNKWEICKEGYKQDVDSSALFKGISEKGVKETLPMANGAYSIVYLDENEGTVNFCRNDERPMFFVEGTIEGYTKNEPLKKFIFFGSEYMMICWAMNRRGFKVGEIHPAQPWTHYTWKPGQEKPTIFTVEKHVPKVQNGGGSMYGGEWFPDQTAPRARPRQTPALTGPVSTVKQAVDAVANVSTADNPETGRVVVPSGLLQFEWLKNPAIKVAAKQRFLRYFRECQGAGVEVNFIIEDLIPLGETTEVLGRMAGKNNVTLPIIIQGLVSTDFANNVILKRNQLGNIWNGHGYARQLSPDKKRLIVLVRNIDELKWAGVPTDAEKEASEIVENAQC